MVDLPTGTVTLLFTDIEGSTQLLQHLRERYANTLAEYRHVVRFAVTSAGGYEVDTQGDAFFVAFSRAVDAVQAAVTLQREIAARAWPDGMIIRTRIGIHTGEPTLTGSGYVGLDVHRAARLCSAGHGGQVLLSATTRALVANVLPLDVSLRDLGTHRLKDLIHGEQITQLVIADLPANFPPLKTLDTRPNNLPVQRDPLIGRERELAAVAQLLYRDDVGLVTLTGAGGTGKTRLALQVAADVLDEFVDGVWFVDLTPIGDPSLVARTIASTLGLTETGGELLTTKLQEYLHDKQSLLVLDNFEQVIEAGSVVAELLKAGPCLKMLVTSRAPLHLRGEREYAVPPLSVPNPKHLPAFEALSQYDAVQLFIERAQAVKADFTVTNANAPALAEICVRLDGLPLAIELAAARSKLFSPQALLARLGQRLPLLTGGPRDLPRRQQTLRGTIEWSYNLIGTDEQRLFARLAVFAGGWSIEAVEAVCGGGDLAFDVVEILQSLVDKSLVRQQEQASSPLGVPDETRFTMLETIREFAGECLEASGEAPDICQRHTLFFLGLAEAAEVQLTGSEQEVWLGRLEADRDNLRAALSWTLETSAGGSEMSVHGLRLAAALVPFWERRGYWNEARRWLSLALRQAQPPVLRQASLPRAKALIGAGTLAWKQGDYTAAIPLLEASARLFQELGNSAGRASAMTTLGGGLFSQGDIAAARSLFEQSLAIFEEVANDPGRVFALT